MGYSFHGIDHAQLAAPAGREAEARAFYGGVLGWPELPKPSALQSRGGVWFQCGTHQIHIGVQKDFVPAAKAHPAFGVSGLDALRLRLEESGISVQEDEMRAEEGIGRFYCSDPFGNRLEFMERL
ncbi:VOC family protein [Paenibacillus humicus]|uniref:VOC family protein n=1 Tax=Paenibacillus humicus TaxID=412861 RepID=UPI003F13F96D